MFGRVPKSAAAYSITLLYCDGALQLCLTPSRFDELVGFADSTGLRLVRALRASENARIRILHLCVRACAQALMYCTASCTALPCADAHDSVS